ncbi:MAG: HEAT repeat domain-containing protein [Methanothrix sp.]|nr:HEAT repeat domain-containing protein [Methanothrix sp.]
MRLVALVLMGLLLGAVAGVGMATGGLPTVNAFIQALGDNDSHKRMDAAVSLGDLGDPRAVEPLISALNDSNVYVRDEAARALGEIGDRRATDSLIRVLKEDLASQSNTSRRGRYTPRIDRLSVVESLADLADPKSIDILSQILRGPFRPSKSSSVRAAS